MDPTRFVWAVAYINRNFIPTIDRDLKKFGLINIRAYVPTVRVLRKQFKNKQHFEEVPLLFNYGFFRMPYEDGCNKDFLMRLKAMVGGIYNWLYTPDFSEEVDGHILARLMVETVKIKDIARLKRASLLNSIYSSDDLNHINKGDYIVLHGYPFDGIPAEILSVNAKREDVRVRLILGESNLFQETTVAFSNIFYSIYANFDEPLLTDNTLEGISDRSKTGGVDKIMYHGKDE